MNHRPRRTSGQALVEFALVFPVFMIGLLALFDVGRGVFIYSGLTNAAREGARLAIVNQNAASIADRVEDMSFGVAVDETTATYRRATSDTPCAPLAVGCIAVVRAAATWQPVALAPVAFLLSLATGSDSNAPYGAIRFEARSELPIEFECPNASIPAYQNASACPKQP